MQVVFALLSNGGRGVMWPPLRLAGVLQVFTQGVDVFLAVDVVPQRIFRWLWNDPGSKGPLDPPKAHLDALRKWPGGR